MICARCTEPIHPDQKAEEIHNHGATGVGGVVIVHAEGCRRAPQQTAPTRR